MKNLKLLLAGLMVVSFAACSSGGGHDGATVKEEIGTSLTIISAKNTIKNKATIENKNNTKKIDLSGKSQVGLKIDDNNPHTNSGVINISGEQSIGLAAVGKNSKITNTQGTHINISGKDSVGMYAKDGGYAVNEGDIVITGHNNIGMLADGNNSVIENTKNGTIHLIGNDTTIDNDGTHNAYKELGRDKHGNVGMVATHGGKIINHGKIIFDKK